MATVALIFDVVRTTDWSTFSSVLQDSIYDLPHNFYLGVSYSKLQSLSHVFGPNPFAVLLRSGFAEAPPLTRKSFPGVYQSLLGENHTIVSKRNKALRSFSYLHFGSAPTHIRALTFEALYALFPLRE